MRPAARLITCLLALLALFMHGQALEAQSSGCRRAQSAVEAARKAWARGNPDHRSLASRLSMAQGLCPGDPEVWRYSACSAEALGDREAAKRYTDLVVLNGGSELSCGPNNKALQEAAYQNLGPVGQKFALLVGVSEFADPTVPSLSFAAKDARDLRTALLDPHYGNFDSANVILLTDADATRANILDAIDTIARWSQPEDLVVLFFSSHGWPRDGGSGLQQIGYVLSHDSEQRRLISTSIEFPSLTTYVSGISARRKVLLLDTCFSGQVSTDQGAKALLTERGVSGETAELFLTTEGTFMLLSSGEDERSYESAELRNGYFTYYLIEALRQGSVPPTIGEVFRHLRSRVVTAVGKERGVRQTPQMKPSIDSTKAELRIGVVPSAGAGPALSPPPKP